MASVSSPQAEQLRVAVIGLGAIGGVAAGWLAAAGRYDFVACGPQPIERLTLDAPDGTVTLPLHALTDPAQANPVDWVLLCTKTHATASTAPWLKALCVPSTRVVVLQNGIDHVARVAPFAGAAAVVPALVYFNGERLAGERVRFRHVASDDVLVPDDPMGAALVNIFAPTFLRVAVASDFL